MLEVYFEAPQNAVYDAVVLEVYFEAPQNAVYDAVVLENAQKCRCVCVLVGLGSSPLSISVCLCASLFGLQTLYAILEYPVRTSLARLFVIVFLIVGYLIVTMYTANLTSIVTVNRLKPSAMDIGSAASTSSPIGYQLGSFINAYLQQMGIPANRLVALNNEDEYVEALTSGRVGVIVDENPYLQLFSLDFCDVALAPQPFSLLNLAFAFPKGSQLGLDISQAIVQLSMSGKLQQLREQHFSGINGSCNQPSSSSDSSSYGISSSSSSGISSLAADSAVQLSMQKFLGLYIIFGSVSLGCCLLYVLLLIHRGYRASREAARLQDAQNQAEIQRLVFDHHPVHTGSDGPHGADSGLAAPAAGVALRGHEWEGGSNWGGEHLGGEDLFVFGQTAPLSRRSSCSSGESFEAPQTSLLHCKGSSSGGFEMGQSGIGGGGFDSSGSSFGGGGSRRVGGLQSSIGGSIGSSGCIGTHASVGGSSLTQVAEEGEEAEEEEEEDEDEFEKSTILRGVERREKEKEKEERQGKEMRVSEIREDGEEDEDEDDEEEGEGEEDEQLMGLLGEAVVYGDGHSRPSSRHKKVVRFDVEAWRAEGEGEKRRDGRDEGVSAGEWSWAVLAASGGGGASAAGAAAAVTGMGGAASATSTPALAPASGAAAAGAPVTRAAVTRAAAGASVTGAAAAAAVIGAASGAAGTVAVAATAASPVDTFGQHTSSSSALTSPRTDRWQYQMACNRRTTQHRRTPSLPNSLPPLSPRSPSNISPHSHPHFLPHSPTQTPLSPASQHQFQHLSSPPNPHPISASQSALCLGSHSHPLVPTRLPSPPAHLVPNRNNSMSAPNHESPQQQGGNHVSATFNRAAVTVTTSSSLQETRAEALNQLHLPQQPSPTRRHASPVSHRPPLGMPNRLPSKHFQSKSPRLPPDLSPRSQNLSPRPPDLSSRPPHSPSSPSLSPGPPNVSPRLPNLSSRPPNLLNKAEHKAEGVDWEGNGDKDESGGLAQGDRHRGLALKESGSASASLLPVPSSLLSASASSRASAAPAAVKSLSTDPGSASFLAAVLTESGLKSPGRGARVDAGIKSLSKSMGANTGFRAVTTLSKSVVSGSQKGLLSLHQTVNTLVDKYNRGQQWSKDRNMAGNPYTAAQSAAPPHAAAAPIAAAQVAGLSGRRGGSSSSSRGPILLSPGKNRAAFEFTASSQDLRKAGGRVRQSQQWQQQQQQHRRTSSAEDVNRIHTANRISPRQRLARSPDDHSPVQLSLRGNSEQLNCIISPRAFPLGPEQQSPDALSQQMHSGSLVRGSGADSGSHSSKQQSSGPNRSGRSWRSSAETARQLRAAATATAEAPQKASGFSRGGRSWKSNAETVRQLRMVGAEGRQQQHLAWSRRGLHGQEVPHRPWHRRSASGDAASAPNFFDRLDEGTRGASVADQLRELLEAESGSSQAENREGNDVGTSGSGGTGRSEDGGSVAEDPEERKLVRVDAFDLASILKSSN
ncbi:unnamed protein product [Closterium sp. NIES-54]